MRSEVNSGDDTVRKTILISALAAIAAASAASGAGAQGFDGFYVGAHGGYGKVDNDGGTDVDGGLGGIHGGYNYVTGAVLFGIEGDYSWSDLSYSESASGITAEASINYFASLRGRLGWLYSPSTLFYATAGYSWSEIEGKVTISGLGSASQSFDLDGAVLGGGVEYKFSRAFSARLEGLHYWGGNDDEFGDDEAQTNVIRAGLSYYFK
jgi:outer membrane immunogenic protein